MKKYNYAKIDGFAVLVTEQSTDWYPYGAKVVDGNEVDHEGNRVRRGHVFAQSDTEAYEKVRKLLS